MIYDISTKPEIYNETFKYLVRKSSKTAVECLSKARGSHTSTLQ